MLSFTYRTKGSYFKKLRSKQYFHKLRYFLDSSSIQERATDLTDGAAGVRQGPGKGRRSIKRDKKNETSERR